MEMEFLNQRDYFDYYNQDLLDFITNYIIPYNSQFERRSEYLYYKRILEMLFQEDFLKEDIQSKIALYFPSITITSLEVTSETDQNQVFVNLYYNIKDTGITDQIEIAFE